MDYPNYNYSRFQLVESEAERKIYVRQFSGRITKARFKRLKRQERIFTGNMPHCGHDWDCCGCLSSVSAKFTYSHNLVTFEVKEYFNY